MILQKSVLYADVVLMKCIYLAEIFSNIIKVFH